MCQSLVCNIFNPCIGCVKLAFGTGGRQNFWIFYSFPVVCYLCWLYNGAINIGIYIRHIQSVWAHWYAAHRHKVAALLRYPPYLAQILGFWVNYGVEMMWLHHGWGWQLPQTASCIYIRHIQSAWAHWYAVHRHKVASLTQSSTLLGLDLGAMSHLCGVKMMSLHHGWGWQPPQTASCIHVNHIQTVWAHWYAVYRYTVAALHSYTHPTWSIFLGMW